MTMHDPRAVVAGDTITRTLAAFQQACAVHLVDEQAKPLPDNSLVALLADAVRLSRECSAHAAQLSELQGRLDASLEIGRALAKRATQARTDADVIAGLHEYQVQQKRAIIAEKDAEIARITKERDAYGEGGSYYRSVTDALREDVATKDQEIARLARENRHLRDERDEAVAAVSALGSNEDEIARLKSQALDISERLRLAGAPSMPLPEAVGWLARRADEANEKGRMVWPDTDMSPCPKCGAWVEDLDGFGVLAHLKPHPTACGYCSHPSRTGGVCGICGEVESVNGTPYLKDGETPAECIKRNRDDVDTALSMLAKEQRTVAAQTEEIERLKAEATKHQGCVCPICLPPVIPGPQPSQEDIDKLEGVAWDANVDKTLVWYRDTNDMLKQRLRESEAAMKPAVRAAYARGEAAGLREGLSMPCGNCGAQLSPRDVDTCVASRNVLAQRTDSNATPTA